MEPERSGTKGLDFFPMVATILASGPDFGVRQTRIDGNQMRTWIKSVTRLLGWLEKRKHKLHAGTYYVL
jgi:hypothetical protein